MITYNHSQFIGEAIEAVLNQKTRFNLELVIGEDCSIDNTRIICEQYAARYPGIIKLLPSHRN
ncbi:MAG: glycosyltransferase, partial [Chitinophagaceae bacterium]|nr:glycosyltransferase [Chitinophagaceae bacterium]